MNLLIIRLIIFAVIFYAGLKLYGIYRQRKLEHEAQHKQVNRHEGAKWCAVAGVKYTCLKMKHYASRNSGSVAARIATAFTRTAG